MLLLRMLDGQRARETLHRKASAMCSPTYTFFLNFSCSFCILCFSQSLCALDRSSLHSSLSTFHILLSLKFFHSSVFTVEIYLTLLFFFRAPFIYHCFQFSISALCSRCELQRMRSTKAIGRPRRSEKRITCAFLQMK